MVLNQIVKDSYILSALMGAMDAYLEEELYDNLIYYFFIWYYNSDAK